MPSEELEFLYRILATIKSYLEDFIIIGGFGSLLYQFHEKASSTLPFPLVTYDIDIAAGRKVPIRGDKSVHQLLLEAGLKEELTGSFRPPVAKYIFEDRTPSLYYVEFLTPLSGSENKRNGRSDGTHIIQLKLSAQKLRYLNLLFQDTWRVNTASIPALEKYVNLPVRIPHPNMFIMQKILISGRRPRDSRSKDFAYIYLTLTCFRRDLELLAHEYSVLLNNRVWKKWYRDFIRLSRQIFNTPDSDGPVEASSILNNVTPAMISAVAMRFINNCPNI